MRRAYRKAYRLIDDGFDGVDLVALERLLEQLEGNWPESVTEEGPLHAATGKGPELVRWLLERGAPPDGCVESGRRTPLHIACGYRDFETIEMLLNYGADPTRLNPEGSTPLYVLLDRPGRYSDKLPSAIRHLCSAGASPNEGNLKQGESPLLLLCSKKRTSGECNLAKVLVELGASIDQPDRRGYSPRMACEYSGNKKLGGLLDQMGASQEGLATAKLHAALSGHRSLPLFLLTRGRSRIRAGLRALDEGADPNVRDLNGELPLSTALLHADDELVEELIRRGAQIDGPVDDSRTPLIAAVESGREAWVRRLLEAGADPQRDSPYGPALECAEDPEIEALLRERIENTWSETPRPLRLVPYDADLCFCAVEAPRAELGRLLVEVLAEPEHVACRGEKPEFELIQDVQGRQLVPDWSAGWLIVELNGSGWVHVTPWNPTNAGKDPCFLNAARLLSQRSAARKVIYFENDDFLGYLAYAEFTSGLCREGLLWGDAPVEIEWLKALLDGLPDAAEDEKPGADGGLLTSKGLTRHVDPGEDVVDIVRRRQAELNVPASQFTAASLETFRRQGIYLPEDYGFHKVGADLLLIR